MQKYIAVVNPKMDDDEITRLIEQGIAGALFLISHQNYPLATKLIQQLKELSRKQNRPVSIIQDVSEMQDPLDLQFGMRAGVDWVATDKPEHVKLARGLDKLAGVIFKGRNLPQGIKIDSIMSDSFVDPDASVSGMEGGQIKHLVSSHKNQDLMDSLLEIASHAGSSGIAVSDLGLAKALSFRRPAKKIIYAPKDQSQAARGAIYWGVHPIYRGSDLITSLKNSRVVKKRGQDSRRHRRQTRRDSLDPVDV